MTKKSLQNNQKPIVSVIIPFFNREDYLSEAVESVIAQTITDWEIILVDDGSTDKSNEIAKTYVERFPNKIKVLNHPNKENRGASESRNLGISKSSGEFITFLDSDDIYFKDTFEKELKAFEENPNVDAVCGTLECWYSWSDKAESWEKDFVVDLVLETEKIYEPPELLVHNLKASGRKPGINCVIVKSVFANQFQLFENDYRFAWEDQVFWAKVSLYGRVYVLDAVLSKYRQHPASTCAIESESGEDIPSMNIFLNWLETYLVEKKIEDENVWNALRSFQKVVFWETKFWKLKQLYRRILPLHMRYSIRDKITKIKQTLLRSSHR